MDKDFFLSVLGTSATKRDAKGYLSRFLPAKSKQKLPDHSIQQAKGSPDQTPYARGVNLGDLFSHARAIAQSPVFSHQHDVDRPASVSSDIHVSVVKIKDPQDLDDETLQGVAITLGQLSRLGMTSVVVVDCTQPPESSHDDHSWRSLVSQQASRLVAAIQRAGKTRAQVMDQTLSLSQQTSKIPSNLPWTGGTKVNYSQMLMSALKNGIIPVMPPVAYNDLQQATKVSANDVVIALTKELAGLNASILQEKHDATNDPVNLSSSLFNAKEPVSLDRIIVLDSAGGIPAPARPERSHIFINMEHEYQPIRQELLGGTELPGLSVKEPERKEHTLLGASNPLSKFAEDETPARGLIRASDSINQPDYGTSTNSHVENLDLMRQALTLLPPSSSALVIRPQDVASSAMESSSDAGVRTRQQRNPLIHNLLTDKPIISSSLPSGRFVPASISSTTIAPSTQQQKHATFFKRGMPVTIIPDPLTSPWTPPGPNGTSLNLSDPRIDFPRLLHLIEDSFGRKLDVQHYLDRIHNHLAGIIIAGEYEGGAILTWENPPRSSSPSSYPTHPGANPAASRPSTGPRPPIPYLDKFAVLQRSQGAGGVADIVFNAMVRTCLPKGVVWRSRKNNPVNRWYFERAEGTWKIPDTQWTMFWTGSELWGGEQSGSEKVRDDGEDDVVVTRGKEWREQRWKDYVAVCKGIEASWADTKAPD